MENAMLPMPRRWYSFRIYSDRYLVILDELSCLIDSLHGFSRIFAVYGEETAASDDPAPERHVEILFFGNESNIKIFEQVPGSDRI